MTRKTLRCFSCFFFFCDFFFGKEALHLVINFPWGRVTEYILPQNKATTNRETDQSGTGEELSGRQSTTTLIIDDQKREGWDWLEENLPTFF